MRAIANTTGQSVGPRHAGRRWLCLLLVLSLWRGPVPWCHVHVDAAEFPCAAPTLAWHLQCLHRGTDASATTDWHWHFVMPADMDGDGREDGERGELLVSAPGGNGDGRSVSLRHSPVDAPLEGMLIPGCGTPPAILGVPSETGRDGPSEPRQFRSGPAVRLLAGVALC